MRQELYQYYTAEAARLLTENVARLSRGGTYIQIRYTDLLKPPETRTEEEIISRVFRSLGVKQDESV